MVLNVESLNRAVCNYVLIHEIVYLFSEKEYTSNAEKKSDEQQYTVFFTGILLIELWIFPVIQLITEIGINQD